MLESTVAFLTLVAMELVLGIDNVIFITILAAKLPKKDQRKARVWGLSIAVISRILLLFSLSWVIGLVQPLFHIYNQAVSGRDLILIFGGLFLIFKATHELHQKVEEGNKPDVPNIPKGRATMPAILTQIFILDLVFSLDSVITAVGMVDNLQIMVAAVLVSTFIMVVSAGPLGDFVQANPTLKVLALSFLMLIGAALVAEGFDQHFPKGYIYFAMAFSLGVEMINIRIRRR